MSEMQRAVIDIIIENPKVSQIEITRRLNSTEGYISKIINRFYKLGVLRRDIVNKHFIKMEIDNKQFIKLINEEKHFTKGKIFRIFNECLTGE